MKQIYFLLIMTIFCYNHVNAETCPIAGTTSFGGTQIIFSHTPATSSCANRPTIIEINGTTTFSLETESCSETISVYNLTSGPTISGQNFTVTRGFDSTCSYSGGTLPIDEFKNLNKQIKIYPNPLISGNEIYLSFGTKNSFEIGIYNVTGKLILKTNTNNEDLKAINIGNFSKGLYLVKISTNKVSVSRKLVVLK